VLSLLNANVDLSKTASVDGLFPVDAVENLRGGLEYLLSPWFPTTPESRRKCYAETENDVRQGSTWDDRY